MNKPTKPRENSHIIIMTLFLFGEDKANRKQAELFTSFVTNRKK